MPCRSVGWWQNDPGAIMVALSVEKTRRSPFGKDAVDLVHGKFEPRRSLGGGSFETRIAAFWTRPELPGREVVSRVSPKEEPVLFDVRYALRLLVRRPGFAVVAVLTLALGIGANTAIFSAARVTLLQPLPFENEEELVRVFLTPEAGGALISLRSELFLAIQERAQAFESIVAQRFTTYALTTDSGPERVVGIGVSAGWGKTLGIRPVLGRLFSPSEEAVGEEAGVLLVTHLNL